MKNVFQAVRDTDFFQSLLSALEAVGLSDTLSGPGPFTLFAPVDGAFKKLASENQEKNFQNKWKLRQTLTSHVMADKVTIADIENMGLVKMMNDNIFNIEVSHDGIMIDGAKIIQGDILCSNGVIHAVDGIIQNGVKG
jgi:uncharacterized surface protein with fasciclin (FAS1) repeats